MESAREAEEKEATENRAEGDETKRRFIPFGLIAFTMTCVAMMVALTYYVWLLIARL